jgi:hypothetical protein
MDFLVDAGLGGFTMTSRYRFFGGPFMRKPIAVVMFTIAASLLAPRPAAAQMFILRWISSLDPGGFTGVGWHQTVSCRVRNDPKSASAELFKTPCDQDETKYVTRMVGFDVAFASGSHNLDYPKGAVTDGRVQVLTLMGTLDFRVKRSLDVGGGAGVAGFWGSAAGSFNKLVIEPHLLVRPFLNADGGNLPTLIKGFGIRVGYVAFPQGFTVADFGALQTARVKDLTGSAEGSFSVLFVIGGPVPRK